MLQTAAYLHIQLQSKRMNSDPRASVAGPLEVRLQNHLVVYCFEDLCTWM